MVLKEKAEAIIRLILDYKPPAEIDSIVSEMSESFYDDVISSFFLLRVLANIQHSIVLYYIYLSRGKLRKRKTSQLVSERARLSARRKSLKKIIDELKRIQAGMEEMTEEQKILYKKEHMKDLEYIFEYYLSFLKKTEREFCRSMRSQTRRRFGKDRWWNWFRFTELGKEFR